MKQASEPLLLHEYDSDDGYKAYYTSDLTVEYPDPDTGEKVSGILKVKEKRAENIPAVGKEVHIYIRELGKSKMLVLAQPEITYYIASGMGVVLLIGFLIFFIVRWPK
ncbi:MAG: hypothetical protein J5842_06660 [Lachnospiraceae bacterium]|nr:hypothetical protein [Lachnospiraceae bacterium]